MMSFRFRPTEARRRSGNGSAKTALIADDAAVRAEFEDSAPGRDAAAAETNDLDRGWHRSSLELRAGLEVIEHASFDQVPLEWRPHLRRV